MIDFREDWIDMVVEITNADDLNGLTGTVRGPGTMVEDYEPGNVRVILKATAIVKDYTSRGYELHVLRYRLVRELMQIGKHAHPLVQLAMLGDCGD